MSLNILKNENIILYNKVDMNYYIKEIPTLKTSTYFSSNPINDITQDSAEISNDAKLKYNYVTELENSNIVSNNKQFLETNSSVNDTFLSDDSTNPEFIENYSLKYVQMRKEILEKSSPDEATKKINLLDTTYNDAINSAAESLASDFQSFFDYASNGLNYNNSGNGNDKFDVEAFRNNILSLANEAFSVVKQAFKDNNFDNLQSKIEDKLSNIQSGKTIEDMSYTDIKEVVNFLKSIPKLKNHTKEYFDDGTYNPIPGNWSIGDAINTINQEYTMAKNFLNSGKASDSVKKNVYNTVLKNISVYHKSFALGYQTDQNQNGINKDKSNYKLLKEQYENFEKKLDAAKKQHNMKMVLAYLEILSSLKAQLAEASTKLAEDMDAQNKLSQNPGSVEETDAYKDISNGEIFSENQG